MPMEKPSSVTDGWLALTASIQSRTYAEAVLDGVQRIVDGGRQREPGEAGPGGNGGPHRGHREVPGQHVRQAEQVLLVGAVAVQQDQERLAGTLVFGLGPQDNGGGKGFGVSHGSILTVTGSNNYVA